MAASTITDAPSPIDPHHASAEFTPSVAFAGFRKTGEVIERKNTADIRGQIAKVMPDAVCRFASSASRFGAC